MTGYAITVDIAGTRHTANPTAGDLVRFERHFDMPAGQIEAAGGRVEHVLFIAWAALHRTGAYPDDFETFIDAADMADTADPPTTLPPPD